VAFSRPAHPKVFLSLDNFLELSEGARVAEAGTPKRRSRGQSTSASVGQGLAAPYVEALAKLHGELLRRLAAEVQGSAVPSEFAALFGSAARADMHHRRQRIELRPQLGIVGVDALTMLGF